MKNWRCSGGCLLPQEQELRTAAFQSFETRSWCLVRREGTSRRQTSESRRSLCAWRARRFVRAKALRLDVRSLDGLRTRVLHARQQRVSETREQCLRLGE